tara:strand:- start:466 stop:930 length:465 start_codon:yes stop_codon:yes gene_type:complete
MSYNNKDIKRIVDYISEEYNIPKNTLKNQIINLLDNNSISNCNKCIAITGNKKQCTRTKSDGDFCKTHSSQKKNNCLKYGCIKINTAKYDNNEDIENIYILKENKKNKTRLEYLTINNIDYLYDPITKIVYNFETKLELGKLSNDFEIIKKFIK